MSTARSNTLRLLAYLAPDAPLKQPQRPRPPGTADRQPTSTRRQAPYSLDLLTARQDHEANVAAFVARHGGPLEPSPARGLRLFEWAGTIASADDKAALELAALDLADRLALALTAG